jgi:hypothetical protein
MSPTTAKQIRLAENLARAALSPLEEAAQLAQMIDLTTPDLDQLAKHVTKSPRWIADRLAMLDYPDYLQKALHDGTIKPSAAKHLAAIPDDKTRRLYVDCAIQGGITTRTAIAWRQQATTHFSQQENGTNFCDSQPPNPSEIKTYVRCALCLNDTEITATVPMRACAACANELHTAQTAKPATPPTPPH